MCRGCTWEWLRDDGADELGREGDGLGGADAGSAVKLRREGGGSRSQGGWRCGLKQVERGLAGEWRWSWRRWKAAAGAQSPTEIEGGRDGDDCAVRGLRIEAHVLELERCRGASGEEVRRGSLRAGMEAEVMGMVGGDGAARADRN